MKEEQLPRRTNGRATNGHARPLAHDPTDLNDVTGATPADQSMDRAFTIDFSHRIQFTWDAFDPRNTTLRDAIEAGPDSLGRSVVFVDDGVAAAWPDLATQILRYAEAHRDVMSIQGGPHVVTGGERAKNTPAVYDEVTRVVEEAGICRHSYVIAIGGGAMLDVVGFAAATSHRGVRLIRLPTTTLAQDDAGIGVKNGINAFGKKNFLGSFSVPAAVINDERFLTTLSDRDWRAGLAEAVKVALLKDPALFEHIVRVAPRLRARDAVVASPIIRRSAELHLDHIAQGGDPFELLNARPLDFGHWAAHKLEEMTDFRMRHGEAVAIGIALDCIYAERTGLLPADDLLAVLDCLTAIGFGLYDDALADHAAVLSGLEEFREHLGGRLTITLLVGIGRSVDVHEIDTARMVESIRRLADYAASVASAEGQTKE